MRAAVLALCLVLSHGAVAQQSDIDALTAAATEGQAEAQLALALRFEAGEGTVQNYATAADWLAKAAEQGNIEAAHRLGQYYASGVGVAQDREAALRWLGKAAESGEAQRLHDYASVLEQGSAEEQAQAAVAYAEAAASGHVEAQISLGVLYQNGTGVAQDLARARQLYEGPAEAGNARAQNNLGLLYVRGEGVPQDYERAFALFDAAAAQGLPVAMRNLGVMYANGFGVAVDEAKAEELYALAARDGEAIGEDRALPVAVFDRRLAEPDVSEEGLRRLQSGIRAGDPLALFTAGWLLTQEENSGWVELRQAAQYFHASAQAGNAAAMTNLGLMYFDGRALPQDYVLGYMWLVLAGTAGYPEALDLGAALAPRMTQEQIAQAQAMAEARVSR